MKAGTREDRITALESLAEKTKDKILARHAREKAQEERGDVE